jgi:hypothetical protein
MLADANTTNERPDVEESYGSAVSASSLKVEPHRRTAADMVIAAGMNSHRMGLALMRLRTEWDRSAKPLPLAPAAIERLAAQLPRVEAGQHAGMVREKLMGGEERFRLPLVVAKEQADAWHAHELGLLLQQLKTLPAVRAGLVHWAAEQELEDGVHVVTAVLLWWLDPACAACGGTGKNIIPGTGGRSKKACGECRKNPNPGERKVPHGGLGRKVLAYLNECRRGARVELDGKFRHQRRPENG